MDIRKIKIVLSKKVDMDSCMTAAIIKDEEEAQLDIVAIVDKATPEQLEDEKIFCVEVGGSGQSNHHNFDHHVYYDDDPEYAGDDTACQAAQEYYGFLNSNVNQIAKWDIGDRNVAKAGMEIAREVFKGMLLSKRKKEEQYEAGIYIMQNFRDGIFSPQNEEEQKWFETAYAYDKQVEVCIKNAVLYEDGKIVFIETNFFGGIQAMQQEFCKARYYVAYNPKFGEDKIRKYTIAVRPEAGLSLNGITSRLNKIDQGWGGPSTGTIVGSPHGGSKLEPETVISVVKEI